MINPLKLFTLHHQRKKAAKWLSWIPVIAPELTLEFSVTFERNNIFEAYMIVTDNKTAVIRMSREINEERQDFAFLHEIAHLVLQHKALAHFMLSLKPDIKEQYARQEKEADELATQWLARLKPAALKQLAAV